MLSKFYLRLLIVFLITLSFKVDSAENFQSENFLDFHEGICFENMKHNCQESLFIREQHSSKYLRYHSYDVYSSDEKQFVWFCVYKVASRTIFDILTEQVPDLKRQRLTKLPKKFKDYFKFAFVRNPWDRVVSCYFHKVLDGRIKDFRPCYDKNFNCFVNLVEDTNLKVSNPHIKLQSKLIPADQCDFIGRLENFADDLKYVSEMIGIDVSHVPHTHQTDRKHYSAYYTSKTRDIIAEKYQKDIETFGFTFETQ